MLDGFVIAPQSQHMLKGNLKKLELQDVPASSGGEMVLEVKNAEGRKMTRQEAGRKGGEKVARERGAEFFRTIGRKGGEKVAEERGSEFYRQIGRKGGESRRNLKPTNKAKGGLGKGVGSKRPGRNKEM
jgi:uncharacterized protein